MALSKSKSSARFTGGKSPAHELINVAAYKLFSRFGVRAVSVDQVIAQSGVAKATLYRHFPTKEHLVLAFLRRRETLWTQELQQAVERIGGLPGNRLLAVFDVYDKWFRKSDFDGCAFVNVMLETHKNPVIRGAAIAHLTTLRKFLEQIAREAGVTDAEEFGWKWHILMKGSIIAAGEGDRNAARRAREMGKLLLLNEGVEFANRPGLRMPAARAVGSVMITPQNTGEKTVTPRNKNC